jgi:3-phenylpropionate/cinnamic acid dioxygenase small subunit
MSTTTPTAAEDRDAIHELLARYNEATDDDDFDGWAACFADGGVFQGAFERFELPTELPRYVEHASKLTEGWPNLRHYVTNVRIALDGDRATCRSFLLMTSTAPGAAPANVMAGTYDDELVRDAGGDWRFASRTVTMDGAA